jgi:hypothetical protein
MVLFLRSRSSGRKLRLFACAYARTGSWLDELRAACTAHFYDRGRQKPDIDIPAAQAALLALRRPAPGSARACTFRGRPPFGAWGEQVVAQAEWHADGAVNYEGLRDTWHLIWTRLADAASGAAHCGPSAHDAPETYRLLLAAVAATGASSAAEAQGSAEHHFVCVADSGPRRQLNPAFREPLLRQTRALQVDLLREIVGNPFRPSPPLPAEVRAWNGGTVVRLARAMYEARDFSNLGILADALLDAGCADEALLAHCRSGEEHVRGCWAVDCVLGKS